MALASVIGVSVIGVSVIGVSVIGVNIKPIYPKLNQEFYSFLSNLVVPRLCSSQLSSSDLVLSIMWTSCQKHHPSAGPWNPNRFVAVVQKLCTNIKSVNRLPSVASRKRKSECKSGYTVTLSDFCPSRDSQVKKSKTESILDSKMPLSQLSQLPVTSSFPLSVSLQKDQQPPNPSCLKHSHTSYAKHNFVHPGCRTQCSSRGSWLMGPR